MKSALTLVAIGSLCALGLALLNDWTEPRVQRQAAEAKLRALARALPSTQEAVRPMPQGSENTTETFLSEKNGHPTGYLFSVQSPAGYNGMINAWLSVNLAGNIRRIYTFSHQETPGIGHIIEPHQPFVRQFEGINLLSDRLELRSKGGHIDAVTGATITSRAMVDALIRGRPTFLAANSHAKSVSQ